MKKVMYFLAIYAMISLDADAKIWRVNNIAGVNADFSTIAAAVAAAAAGDSIYVEGSPTNYAGTTLNKKLVIIGPGYFLSGANSNAGLQANPEQVNFGNLFIDSSASGSVLLGLAGVNIYNASALGYGADNITISRCIINAISIYYSPAAGTIADNWNINKCYLGSFNGNIGIAQNWNVSNNIFTGYLDMSNAKNSGNVIRNNVFRSSINLYNAYFANNIMVNTTITLTNCVVKNNLANGNPAGFASYVGSNGNTSGHTDALLFQGLIGNSTDGQYRLATGSPAIGAGLTVGTVVSPDAGAFGGPDPYRLSGIPPIPTIYSLTVPAAIPSGSSTMSVTLSSKNNN